MTETFGELSQKRIWIQRTLGSLWITTKILLKCLSMLVKPSNRPQAPFEAPFEVHLGLPWDRSHMISEQGWYNAPSLSHHAWVKRRIWELFLSLNSKLKMPTELQVTVQSQRYQTARVSESFQAKPDPYHSPKLQANAFDTVKALHRGRNPQRFTAKFCQDMRENNLIWDKLVQRPRVEDAWHPKAYECFPQSHRPRIFCDCGPCLASTMYVKLVCIN